MTLSIRAKLLLGFAVVLALTMVVGVAGYRAANELNDGASYLYNDEMQRLSAIESAQTNSVEITVALREAIASANRAQIQADAQEAADLDTEMSGHLAYYEKLIDDGQTRVLFQQVLKGQTAYEEASARILELVKQGKSADALRALEDAKPAISAIDNGIDMILEQEQARAEEANADNAAVFTTSRNLILGSIALAILFTHFPRGRCICASPAHSQGAERAAVGGWHRLIPLRRAGGRGQADGHSGARHRQG
jgi:methyl-accepting chemotaxis protein